MEVLLLAWTENCWYVQLPIWLENNNALQVDNFVDNEEDREENEDCASYTMDSYPLYTVMEQGDQQNIPRTQPIQTNPDDTMFQHSTKKYNIMPTQNVNNNMIVLNLEEEEEIIEENKVTSAEETTNNMVHIESYQHPDIVSTLPLMTNNS